MAGQRACHTELAGPRPRVSCSGVLWWGPRINISNKLLGADAVRPGPTLEELTAVFISKTESDPHTH